MSANPHISAPGTTAGSQKNSSTVSTLEAGDFPVFRYGRLVTAEIEQNGAYLRRTFSPEESEQIICELERSSALVTERTQEIIRQAAKELGIAITQVDSKASTYPDRLATHGRSQSLGAVYDFDELLFALDGHLVRIRTCVTICISSDTNALTPLDDIPQGHISHSKLWVRFIQGDTVPSQMAFEGFRENCQRLSTRIIDELNVLYRDAIVNAIPGIDSLRINDGHLTFEVSSFDSADEGLASLFRDVREGATLQDLLPTNGAVKRLVAGFGVADEQAEMLLAQLRTEGSGWQALVVEKFDCEGVYIARFENRVAEFRGMARRLSTSKEISAARDRPSSLITAVLISEYAVRF